MSDPVYSKASGALIGDREVIKDQIGRDWLFSFGARPGIRNNAPEGEIWVKKPNAKSFTGAPFALYFFPDLTFDKPEAI